LRLRDPGGRLGSMRICCLGFGILVALAVLAAPAGAANQTVNATISNQFSPRDVTVNLSDSVTWNNTGGFHNVHFDDNSFVQPSSASFDSWSVSRTFTTAGTFRYYCDIHGAPNGVGMSGTVTVNGDAVRAASPVRTPLAVAYKPCTIPSTVHGAPIAQPACGPPVQESDWLTVGTFNANRRVANATGSVLLRVAAGDPGTPADEANVELVSSVTDVRRKDDLSDYAGELQAVLPLRITDSNNGPAASERATGDTTFTFPIPCLPTGDSGVGSTCEITTSADAVAPGAVPEGKSSNWEVGKVQVFDGGADDVAATAGNTLFMSQGVFAP
jgi:plastocyanin